jgi:hypothetical protein
MTVRDHHLASSPPHCFRKSHGRCTIAPTIGNTTEEVMTKIKCIVCLLCLIILSLVACSPSREEPIRPGDEVGGFLVTTGEADEFVDFLLLFDQICERDGAEVDCTAVPGTTFSASYLFYGDTVADLDAMWSAAGYEIYIEDRPVDLASFGTVDFDHPDTGRPMRAWNVVVEAAEPAGIVIRHLGVAEGEPFDDTMTLTVQAANSD